MIKVRDRDQLKKQLLQKGIITGIHYPSPIPFTEAYAHLEHTEAEFPVAVTLSKEILSLPMYPELSEESVQFVAEAVISSIN